MTIPKALRERFGLRGGAEVVIREEGGNSSSNVGVATQWQHFFVVQLWLTLIAAVVWVADGRPGLALCWRTARSLWTAAQSMRTDESGR